MASMYDLIFQNIKDLDVVISTHSVVLQLRFLQLSVEDLNSSNVATILRHLEENI